MSLDGTGVLDPPAERIGLIFLMIRAGEDDPEPDDDDPSGAARPDLMAA